MIVANENGLSFIQQCSLVKARRKWPGEAEKSAMKEMKQLHDRACFMPTKKEELTALELKQAVDSFLFLVEKKTRELKSRTVANGSAQKHQMDN